MCYVFEEEQPKMILLLKTREETLVFLAAHPDPDQKIQWCCPNPKCNTINDETHHSRATKCKECGEGEFPAVMLPLAQETTGVNLQTLYMKKSLAKVLERIRECDYDIHRRHNEIFNLKKEIENLKKEEKEIERILSNADV